VVAVAAGCGGTETSEPSAAAEAVPASAAAYLSFDADLGSGQWKQVESLVERFPDGGRVLPMIRSQFEEEGVDFEHEVEPAVGPTVELVWLDFRTDDFVALTQPDDDEKLRELARKADEPLFVAQIAGWSALAESDALLDRFRAELQDGSLADDADFRAAQSELPGETLASVYVDGERATSALRDALADAGRPTAQLDVFGRLVAGAAAIEAADDGFRLTGYVRSEGAPPELTDVGALFGEVPADAFFAVNFRGPQLDAGDVPSSPELDELERQLGLSLSELASLFEGEGVLYVRSLAGILPELTLLLEPPDADVAKSRLDTLTAKLPGERTQETIDGIVATTVQFGRFTLVYAAFDGRLVLTTLPSGISALRGGGDKLVDEERYRSAVDAAGIGDDEDVVLYADLEKVVALLEQLGGAGTDQSRISPEVDRNLQPLRALVASLGANGDETTFKLFLEIE
jgi:hypothetical protein